MLLFFIIKCSVDGNCLAGEINCLCIVSNVKPENVLFAHHDCCTTNYKVLQTLKTQGNFSSLTSSPCISHGGNNTGNKSLVREEVVIDVAPTNKWNKITSICLNHNIELVPQWFALAHNAKTRTFGSWHATRYHKWCKNNEYHMWAVSLHVLYSTCVQ